MEEQGMEGNIRELVPIEERDGQKAVNARNLHAWLEVGKDFSNWIKVQIRRCDLMQDVDYQKEEHYIKRKVGGTLRKEYYLTFEAAEMIVAKSNVCSLKRGKIVKRKYKTYLMFDSNTNYVKIGKSVDPRFRESTLQSEKPSISLFAICPADIEKDLHKTYSNNRVRGEWFDLHKNEVENIIKEYGFKKVRYYGRIE